MKKLGSKDKIIEYWNAAAPHLQAKFCHPSLGTKIKIDRIGDFVYAEGKTIKAQYSDLQIMMPFTKQNLEGADLMVHLCSDPNYCPLSPGYTYAGMACNDYDAAKQVLIEWRESPVSFQGVNFKFILTFRNLF